MKKKNLLITALAAFAFALTTMAQTTVPGGQVNGTWNIAGSPYNVTGSIQIPNGQTLTINSGVEVMFQGNYKLVVSGRLLAMGLLNDTINFNCSNTSVGWQGIRFENTAATNDTSIIQYCKLQNGKPADGNGGSFYFSNFSKAIIKNCLIQNNSVAASGGGIYLSSSSPVIKNNTIRYVSSINAGGGIYATSSSSVIEYNTISNIIGGSSWPQIGGGGICISGGSPIIRNNTIQNNSVVPYTNQYGAGAGIYVNGTSNIQITNNIITNNSTSSDKGGGLCIINVSGISNINFNTITNNSQNSSFGTFGGGGIYFEGNPGGGGNTLIKGNTISYNTANKGGGIYFYSSGYNLDLDSNNINNNAALNGEGGAIHYRSGSGGTTGTPINITRNLLSNNSSSSNGGAFYGRYCTPSFANNKIFNNSCQGNGGAFYLEGTPSNIVGNVISNNSTLNGQGGAIFFAGSNATLTNNTISNNNAVKGGAFSYSGTSSNHTNDILYGNSASQSGNQVNVQDVNSNPNFSYCNIQGGSASFEMNNNIYMGNYLNNINSNPLFVSPTSGSGTSFNALNANWQLHNNSPSIDVGSPSGSYPTIDLQGNTRVVGCIIDQGAYENQNSPNAIPTPTITASGPISFCQGGSVVLTSSSGTGNTWSNGATTQSTTVSSSGNYSVTVSNGNCSATSLPTVVTVNPAPTQPTTACYETATFNTTICQWDVTGTQPTQPTTACYETATFNNTTCSWDVTGSPASISQLTNQTVNINSNAQFVVGSTDPSASFQWQTDLGVGFQNLTNAGQYSGATNDTLNVSNATMSNNNQLFRCIVTSGSCSDTSNVAVLTVNNITGINETNQTNLFSVFPNPAQNLINVQADTKLIGKVYSIYDNTGRVVLSGKLNAQNTSIELGTLSGGIYIFSVRENMKQTFKLIKE